jgi:hypothetical protein
VLDGVVGGLVQAFHVFQPLVCERICKATNSLARF